MTSITQVKNGNVLNFRYLTKYVSYSRLYVALECKLFIYFSYFALDYMSFLLFLKVVKILISF
jgi:hypothetical protein